MPLIGKTVTVKPAREGMKIPNPQAKFSLLSDSGTSVVWSRYFDQMWRAGDLLVDGESRVEKPAQRVKGGGISKKPSGLAKAAAAAKKKNSASAKTQPE